MNVIPEKAAAVATAAAGSSVHFPSLAVALVIMLAGSLYPLLMTDAGGHADHRLALVLFLAMSAGFVRGVGFVPQALVWRWMFSGWACLAALAAAIGIRFLW
ncbi:cyd operon YbgE family protein [Actimicrobium antarcticum]|uniref:Cyd operon YbgE family protein n=1 Tax=Actimicrobium antarcticum TaxID=1051899 RepID=A0ABP7SS94_9BURK